MSYHHTPATERHKEVRDYKLLSKLMDLEMLGNCDLVTYRFRQGQQAFSVDRFDFWYGQGWTWFNLYERLDGKLWLFKKTKWVALGFGFLPVKDETEAWEMSCREMRERICAECVVEALQGEDKPYPVCRTAPVIA